MSNIRRTVVIGLVVVSVAAVVVSLVLVGSPSQARLERYDQQRVADLQGLEYAVLTYASRQYRLNPAGDLLPAKLTDIANVTGIGDVFTRDPITQQPYEYLRTGDLKYELCATFEATDVDYRGVDVVGYSWAHGVGRTCFTRMIDPAQLTDIGVPIGKPYPVPPAPLPQ